MNATDLTVNVRAYLTVNDQPYSRWRLNVLGFVAALLGIQLNAGMALPPDSDRGWN